MCTDKKLCVVQAVSQLSWRENWSIGSATVLGKLVPTMTIAVGDFGTITCGPAPVDGKTIEGDWSLRIEGNPTLKDENWTIAMLFTSAKDAELAVESAMRVQGIIDRAGNALVWDSETLFADISEADVGAHAPLSDSSMASWFSPKSPTQPIGDA